MTCSSCGRGDFALSLRCQWCGTPLQAGVQPLTAATAVHPVHASTPLASGSDTFALEMPIVPQATDAVASGPPLVSPPLAPGELDDRPKSGGLKKASGPILAAAFLIFSKLKVIAGALKFGKLAGTFASMIVSVLFYAALFSWKFAIGFVLLIFVHEMGHVIALKRRGIPIEGMYFIPFLGAAVAFKKRPSDPAIDAEISWAGPFAGLLGGIVCAALFWSTGNIFWAVLAHVNFLIDLINMAPSVPLDGGWIVKAINPKFSLFGSLIGVAIGLYLHSMLLVVISALGGFHAWSTWRSWDDDFDRPDISPQARLRITGAYLGLLIILGSALGYSTHVLHEDRVRRGGQDPMDPERSASLMSTLPRTNSLSRGTE